MNPISHKIKEKFGTLKHYSKVRKLDYNTLRQVVYTGRNVKSIKDTLLKDGFIKPDPKPQRCLFCGNIIKLEKSQMAAKG